MQEHSPNFAENHEASDNSTIDTLRTLVRYMGGQTFAIHKGDIDGKAIWTPIKSGRQLTDADLIGHLDHKQPVACYLMKPGTAVTSCAVLDFDNHDGHSSWQQIVDAARRVTAELKKDHLGPSLVVRSRNGKGLHLWLLFVRPFPTSEVRAYLSQVIEACGFVEGAGDVADDRIELFPKQDSVGIGDFGSHITLPFAGSSVVLDRDSFEVTDKVQLNIQGEPPLRQKPEEAKTDFADTEDLAFDLLRGALKYVSPDDRDMRVKVGMAIKNSADDAGINENDAYQIWEDWTDTCTTSDLEWVRRKRHRSWQNFKVKSKSDPKRLTVATVYKLATDAGWIPTTDAKGNPIVSESDHVARARRMRELKRPHLTHYRDDFMDFDAGAYRAVEDGVVKADTWIFLDTAKRVISGGRGKKVKRALAPFQPDRNSVNETIAALKAVAHLSPDVETPYWLNGRHDLPADKIIAFPNGLLDLRDKTLHPIDPNFFTIAALGFDYVATATQ